MTEQQKQSAVENATSFGKDTQQTQRNTANKKGSLFRRSLIAIGLLLVVLTGASTAIIATEKGTELALSLTKKMVDGLHVGNVDGTLQRGLSLNHVEFQSGAVDAKIKQVYLKFDFGCLWTREICIDDIQIHQPQIKIDTTKFAPSEPKYESRSKSMRPVALPLALSIKHMQVERLELQVDQQKMLLSHFNSAVSLNQESGLTLAPTEIDTLNFVSSITEQQAEQQQKFVQQQAKQKAKQTKPIDWVAIEKAMTPALLANVSNITLPFDMRITDFKAHNISYHQYVGEKKTQAIDVLKVHIQAESIKNEITLKTVQINSSIGNLNAKGSLNLTGEMPLNLQLQGDIAKIPRETHDNNSERVLWAATQGEFIFHGALKQITYLTAKIQGEINAELTGQVQLNREKMPLQLKLISPSAQYPFIQDDPLKLKNVTLNVSGDLLDYQASLQGEVEGMGIPHSQVDLNGSGKIYQAQVDKLVIQGLGGSLNLNGNVSWKNGVTWQSAVDLNKINLGGYIKSIPAILSGQLISTGEANSRYWQVSFSKLHVNGSLNQHPLKLTGTLSIGQKEWINASNFILNYGENNLFAQGVLNEQSNFQLTINAPNLRGLLPKLSASLIGKINLTGAVSMPNLDLDLVGRYIQFQDLRLNKLNAKGKIISKNILQGTLNIAAEGFQYGDDIRVNSLNLTAQGDEKNHRLVLHSVGKPVATNFILSGNFDRTLQKWSGVISQTDIQSPVGIMKNSQFHVDYDNKAKNATISAHCWNNPELDLCFPKAFNVGISGNIPFQVKKLDLNIANKWLEKEWFKGRLTSQGQFSWYSDKPMLLDVQVNGDNLSFSQNLNYRAFQLHVPKLTLNTQIQNNNLTVKADIALQHQGTAQAEVGVQDVLQRRKLTGLLKISGINLNLVNQVLHHGENVSGDITANLTFSGNLNAPSVNGHFLISKISSKINAMPFEINQGELALRFMGNHSNLIGHLQTPESRLNLSGSGSWRSLTNWKTEVQAKAHEFYVNVPSLVKLKVSPDVEMRATPNALELSGNVDIPWARVVVESLPDSAVSVSNDEVILDEKSSRDILRLPSQTQDGLAIKSDLRINIGNDVTVDAYGLNSHLQGSLMVKQTKGVLGIYGIVDLKNGRYASFGQDLLIRKGQITFNGLPSQPMLDIEAIRNPEAMENSKIVAGVKVNGLATSPDVTVFSNPSLPQDQALSYLLSGRSLENSGNTGSSGSIGAALLGLGLSKSGKVVGKIGETFGISDLNLGTAGVGDNSKVVVSGNLTKDLQIKYGIGLFNGLAEITLRYRLLPQLFLQSVSSVEQAVDLLYQFEF